MAAADTARLVASLTLDAKGFNSGVKSAGASLGKLEGTIGNIGQKAGQGLKSLGKNLALIGVAAGAGIAVAVKSGLNDLATLETAVTSVDGAIKQLGLTGQVTGDQVAKWANDIERDIGAAFDDKDITKAAATLLRFGKVTPKNLQQALVVMTDLAAKTGDVESAGNLLAKALADPAKAAGKLAKAGVVLTKAQQDTIKEMVKQNDIAGAQQLILDELAKTTGGAAAASQGKYARALSVLNDVAEDSRKALAEGFLPVIEKVADKLSKALADPKFINGLREFGQELAGGLDDLISVAEKLPWATIGDSLKLAGAGAKAVLQAFTSLPPWVQTAVLTGWGLNKLTGGALTGIVGELGKGLIKGVLGIQAANVNITAANVTTAGGVPGAGGPVATGASKLGSLVTKVFIVGAAAGVIAEAFNASGLFDPTHRDKAGNLARTTNDTDERIANILASIKVLQERAAGGDAFAAQQLVAQRALLAQIKGDTAYQVAKTGDVARLQNVTNERAEAIRGQVAAASARAIADSSSERTSIANAAAAQAAAQAQTTHAAQQAAAAIRDKDLSVSVKNYNSISTVVSVRETIKGQTTFKSYNRFQS